MTTVKQLETRINGMEGKLDSLVDLLTAKQEQAERPVRTTKAKPAKAKPAKGKSAVSDAVLDALIYEIYHHVDSAGKLSPKVTKNSSSYWVMGGNRYYVTVGRMHDAED